MRKLQIKEVSVCASVVEWEGVSFGVTKSAGVCHFVPHTITVF